MTNILDYASGERFAMIARKLLPLLLLLGANGFAQQNENASEAPAIRTSVRLVNLLFSVHDKHGALVPILNKEDFIVTEDGAPQTIKLFRRESDLPLTLGLMIDTSGSQAGVLGIEQDSVSDFVREILRPKDLAFLISFDVNVSLESDFTSDPAHLRHALNRVRINTGGGVSGLPGLGGGPISSTPRGTLLYDAVYLAADEKLKSETGRKALILFTDGEDQGSRSTLSEAIEQAERADVICYVILIADRGAIFGFGGGKMRQLAEQTGGRVFDVGDNRNKLLKALDQISAELRSQYNLAYTSTNGAEDGKYRKVDVKTVSSDYKVQARKGYYAPGVAVKKKRGN